MLLYHLVMESNCSECHKIVSQLNI